MSNRQVAVIMDTRKGHGVPDVEGRMESHYLPLTSRNMWRHWHGLHDRRLKSRILNSTSDETGPSAEIEKRTRWRKAMHRGGDALVSMAAPERSVLYFQITCQSIFGDKTLALRIAAPQAELILM
jgi:hypothetical protein